MALFTALRQTLTSKISSFTSRFSSRNSRHRRLPSDPQSFQYQSPTETPNEQTRTPVSAIDMAPVGSAAPVTCHKPERKLFLLRALQLLCMLAFIPCIATASGYTGRWTYASIEATVALGCGATALTSIVCAVYIFFYKELLHPSDHHSRVRRVFYLLARISIDASAAFLWLAAVLTALFPKQTDYQSLFESPPYGTWVASVVLALIECALFVATTFMILVCYRVAPNQGHDHGIELARRVNPDATSSRGPNMPSTGLPRTG